MESITSVHTRDMAAAGEAEAVAGVTAVPQLVEDLRREFTALWWVAEPGAPPLGRSYGAAEQQSRERELERLLDALVAETRNPPRTEPERAAAQERIGARLTALAGAALDVDAKRLGELASRGFPQAASAFARAAWHFDPAISGEDVFQAGRNAWALNALQLLLGAPVRLTPAVFAYSMLYPYTDNYLDDRTIPAEAKAAFGQRLARRLAGETMAPADPHEQRIFALVELIEGQFPRRQYPQVFESLLAIHEAQSRSVQLLQGGASPYEVDVLGIGLDKGGTSVLADGLLVTGSLTRAQAGFMYGWGAFLQCVDDLQDVEQDRRNGLLTIFSQTAGRWPLDGVTSRTLHLCARMLGRLGCFEAPDAELLKQMMRASAALMVIAAAGRDRRLYSAAYLRALEAHSPFRFRFLDRCRRRLAGQRAGMMRLMGALASSGGLPPARQGA